MKKVIGVIGIIGWLMCAVDVHAECEHPHTRVEEFVGYDAVTDSFYPLIGYDDTEDQIDEEIKEGEMEMLAQLIEAEAGNQDYYGKCLVADVVLNRVASDIFPDTVEEVIQQYKTRASDGEDCYQFATVKYGTFDEAGWYISEDSFKAAQQEYEAKERIDGNILYFTAGGYNPYCIPAYKYGDHYFGY